jgi:hypothetical protein
MTKTQRAALEAAIRCINKLTEDVYFMELADSTISQIEAALAEPVAPTGWQLVSDDGKPNGVVLVAYTPTEFPKKQIIVRACYFGKFQEESGSDGEWYEYNEADDTYYIPEGWYECISNWDEYSSIKIHGEVTHWMPLPAAPKP